MSEAVKSRKEKEEEARCEHILKQAEELFADKGLHETSVADIAKASEFGIGTLYKYFKDKNNLIHSLINSRLNAHFDTVDEALAHDNSPSIVVSGFIEAYLKSVKERRIFFKMYFTNFHPGLDELKNTQKNTSSEFYTLNKRRHATLKALAKVFQRGIDIGSFEDINAEYLTTALFGMLMSFTFLAEHKYDGQIDVPSISAAIEKIFFGQMLKGTF